MLVKKYEAADMKQAMDDIVKELGSEAVILSSRKIKKKGIMNLFQKPMMEVTVAYEPRRAQPPKKVQPTLYAGDLDDAPTKIYDKNELASSKEKLSSIDAKIESLDHVLTDFMDKFSYLKRDMTYDFSPEVEKLFLTLLESEVREEIALSLAKETEEILKARGDTGAYEVLHHLIGEYLGPVKPILPKKFKQRVILFLGPTGVGKTTSLVKLASIFAIEQKKKVGIINTDTYRIAAHEQLKTYADILDIPLGIAYRPEEVEGALEDMADRDVIFIDTAGKRPGDPRHREDVTKIIQIASPQEILLCVAASTCFSAIKEVVDTYDFTGDYKLIVTKLDETKYHGMILNVCRYSKRPLAYVTTGQNVPDDMEIADIDSIANRILER